MKLYTTWFSFAGAPAAAMQYFERRRAVTIAHLTTVTRQMRREMDAQAEAARAVMAEAAWAEAGWAETYRTEPVRAEAA